MIVLISEDLDLTHPNPINSKDQEVNEGIKDNIEEEKDEECTHSKET
jgi:hypothetical protein